MALARLWRLFLAAAVVVAMQSSLLHPFEHFHDALAAPGASADATAKATVDRNSPDTLHSQLCGLCVAGAALGAAAPAKNAAEPVVFSGSSSASREETVFLAAFAPLFRSQGPPALL